MCNAAPFAHMDDKNGQEETVEEEEDEEGRDSE